MTSSIRTDGRLAGAATAQPSGPRVAVALRPIGAPLPLGFLALAIGTLVLSGLQLKWFAVSQTHMTALCLLSIVVPLQLISCVSAYAARDSIASTGMGLLTGTWLAIGAVLHAGAPGSRSAGLGLLLIASTGALLSVAAAALITKPLATLVLATTAARFACVGVYELSGRGAWQTATGVIGIVLTAIAWYAATALLLEDVAGRAVLPTLRPGSSRTTEQLFANDLGQLASEPGVRHPA